MRGRTARVLSFLLLSWLILHSRLLASDAAKPFHFNLYSIYGHQWFTVNDGSIWNPGNLFAVADSEARLFLNPEARLTLDVLRLSLSPRLSLDRGGRARTGLREANATLALGRFELTAGKVLMKLGTGYMFTPISVITAAKAVSDPEDNLRGQEGVTMFKADYYRESWSLSAIVFKRENWHNLALFGYATIPGVDFYGLIYYPEYRKLEAGLAVATTVGQGLELHAEAMLRQRSPLLEHRVCRADNPRVSYGEWSLFQPEDRLYLEALLGVNATIKGVSVIAEYSHRDWGLTRRGFANLKDYFFYNLQRCPDPLQSMDIGSAMQVVQAGGRGLMRDYIFARIAKNIGKTDISAITFLNLADFSLMSMVDLNFELADGVAFFIRPIFFSGRPASEFGNSFYSSMVHIGFTAVL